MPRPEVGAPHCLSGRGRGGPVPPEGQAARRVFAEAVASASAAAGRQSLTERESARHTIRRLYTCGGAQRPEHKPPRAAEQNSPGNRLHGHPGHGIRGDHPDPPDRPGPALPGADHPDRSRFTLLRGVLVTSIHSRFRYRERLLRSSKPGESACTPLMTTLDRYAAPWWGPTGRRPAARPPQEPLRPRESRRRDGGSKET